MDEKGSLKDRLKTWWIILVCKKRKEKEEKKQKEEQIKQWQKEHLGKYYTKPKVVLLTILGLFTGIIENKNNTNKTVEQKNKRLLTRVSSSKILIDDQKKIDIILLEINIIKKEIRQMTVEELFQKKEIIKEKENDLKKYEEKYKQIELIPVLKVLSENATIIEKTKKKIKEISTDLTDIQKEIEIQIEVREKEICLVKEEKEKGSNLPKDFRMKKENVNEIIVEKDLEAIKKNMEAEISTAELLILSSKLKSIESKLTDSKKMEECKRENQKVETKIEEKKNLENAKKRTEDDLAEILLMEALIYNNIKKQQKEIENFKKKLNMSSVVNTKKGFLMGISQFISRTIKLTFSLFPLALFKNKKIGLLTSAILVNNSIRSMRSVVGKVEVPSIEFSKIGEKLKKAEDELNHVKFICYDSMAQITSLKEEFSAAFDYKMSPDLEPILSQMNQLENMIKSRANELEKTTDQLQTLKYTNKQKVKRLEEMYHDKY